MSAGYAFRFECRRSGNCCSRPEGRVRVAENEVAAMAALVGLEVDGFRSRFLMPGPHGDSLLKMGLSGACIFLEKEDGLASCTIYEARPEHCRTFPYWADLAEEGPMLRAALRFCPGLEPEKTD